MNKRVGNKCDMRGNECDIHANECDMHGNECDKHGNECDTDENCLKQNLRRTQNKIHYFLKTGGSVYLV